MKENGKNLMDRPRQELPQHAEFNSPAKSWFAENVVLTLEILALAGLVFLLLWVLDAVRAQ